jgi:hypothetical protein
MEILDNLSLNEVLQLIVKQAKKGYKFAENANAPKDPISIYYWLSARTVFVDDNQNYEQLQQISTLLGDRNVHGIRGAGDCDCFTIAILSLLYAAGYNKAYLVLVGNNTKVPTHIFPAVDYMGIIYPLDLTAQGPGIYRKSNKKGKYRGIQYIPVKL